MNIQIFGSSKCFETKKAERWFKERRIKYQNIDGLHQKAGSKNVLELHGSVLRNYCTKCHQFHGVEVWLRRFDFFMLPSLSFL
mgnify:CR=1 FL=1